MLGGFQIIRYSHSVEPGSGFGATGGDNDGIRITFGEQIECPGYGGEYLLAVVVIGYGQVADVARIRVFIAEAQVVDVSYVDFPIRATLAIAPFGPILSNSNVSSLAELFRW